MRAIALLLALLLVAPGCATLHGIASSMPDWCPTERASFAWAAAAGGPFDVLDARAANDPGLAATWTPLKEAIVQAQVALDHACADPGLTPGTIGQLVADAAGLLVKGLNVYSAIAGTRDLARDGEQLALHVGRLERLQVDVAKQTGARSTGSRSRALGGR